MSFGTIVKRLCGRQTKHDVECGVYYVEKERHAGNVEDYPVEACQNVAVVFEGCSKNSWPCPAGARWAVHKEALPTKKRDLVV